MTSLDFEKPKAGKTNQLRGPNEAFKKQKSIPWGMIVVALILLSILAGYFIYTSKFERTSRWAMEDIAPKKSNQILEKAKKTLETDSSREKLRSEDKLVEEISTQDTAVVETGITESQNEVETEITDSQIKDEDQPAKSIEALEASKMLKEKIVIHFDFNSNEINDEAYEKLDEIARFMANNPDSEIAIEGYTDARGDMSYNKRLSEFRANIVKNYLVAKGIEPSKILAIGLGSQNFIASNDTEENRRMNRRVEIKVNTK